LDRRETKLSSARDSADGAKGEPSSVGGKIGKSRLATLTQRRRGAHGISQKKFKEAIKVKEEEKRKSKAQTKGEEGC